MRTSNSESGFTIVELIVASMITLTVIGIALTTFSNAMALNEAATQIADSNQNLRAGTNLLVRDLLQAGRNIPTGGISIPSGAGSVAIYRPSPPGDVVHLQQHDRDGAVGDHDRAGTRTDDRTARRPTWSPFSWTTPSSAS